VNPITDEELGAFLDGELPETERLRIAEAIATDEHLAARLAALEQVDAALGSALPVGDTQLPAAVVTAIDRLAAAQAARAAAGRPDNVIPFARSTAQAKPAASSPDRTWTKDRAWLKYGSFAASVLVVVGAGVLWNISSRAPGPGLAFVPQAAGPLPAQHPLAVTLGETPSGTVRDWSPGAGETRGIQPVLSFRDSAGALCREFELTSGASGTTGVACRRDNRWELEAVAAAASATRPGEGYVPASGNGPAAVEAAIERLMAGDVLTADEEAAALRQ
jgi:hypothetical protein